MNRPIHSYIMSLCVVGFLGLTGCNAGTHVTDAKAASSEKQAQLVPQPGGYSNINNAMLKQMLDKGVTLVDIRLKEEWQQTGIVAGSKTMTFFDQSGRINPDFVPQFTALVKPDQPVALICRTGNRTQAASRAIAEQLGYQNVMNVTHGITGWIAENRPVERYTN